MMHHLLYRSHMDQLCDQLHKDIAFGTWKCWSGDYKEDVSLNDQKNYTFLLQRDVSALQQYIDLVRQTLSMKRSVVEEILFNAAHPEKTTHPLLVYNEHGELVGGICFSVLGILADIDLLVVKPEHHGRGIGSTLLLKCLECAQSHLQVRVAIVQAVDSAKPFYQRLGFCISDPAWITCLELFMRCRDEGDFQVFSQCSGKKRTRYLYPALRSMLLATSDIPKAIEQLRQPKIPQRDASTRERLGIT